MGVRVSPFRPMTASDVPEVLELERVIFPAPWTEKMLYDELLAEGRVYLLARDDDGIAAYGGIMVVESDAHIMTLAVREDRRRKGLASQLLLALIAAGLELGAVHLTLELRTSNEPARALYEKFGFVPVGLRPGYYADEDALVMWAVEADGAAYRDRLQAIEGEVA